MSTSTAVDAVHSLWALFQARDWAGARALLHDDATMHWVASGEHLLDADAIIKVNAIYPEGWSLHVISVDGLANGDVHSIVEVRHGESRFFANSRFQLDAGPGRLIRQITEYWATFEAPPAWRTAEAIGAYRREPLDKNSP
ncbi:MAG TPA: hypothetical protein VLA16_07970 [Ideonella sp.]|nr:hypothetical protein [Ideonella sp.]